MISELRKELQKEIDPKKAVFFPNFFKEKTNTFIDVTVPNLRKIALLYKDLSFSDIKELLASKIHEERLIALFILVFKFQKDDKELKDQIFRFYLQNLSYINNWDLVDSSCYQILGTYLLDKDRSILYKLAKSENIWERRVAIVSTLAFIRKGDLKDTLQISEILLVDKQDLIHKAVGWMLRELGKNDQTLLVKFIKTHYRNIPRTTLRYAIERFPELERKAFLKGV